MVVTHINNDANISPTPKKYDLLWGSQMWDNFNAEQTVFCLIQQYMDLQQSACCVEDWRLLKHGMRIEKKMENAPTCAPCG